MNQEVDLQKQMEEMKKKMKDKREKVIEELINTEKNYMRDLGLCQRAFLSQGAAKVGHIASHRDYPPCFQSAWYLASR
jgi:hypothetical protein